MIGVIIRLDTKSKNVHTDKNTGWTASRKTENLLWKIPTICLTWNNNDYTWAFFKEQNFALLVGKAPFYKRQDFNIWQEKNYGSVIGFSIEM